MTAVLAIKDHSPHVTDTCAIYSGPKLDGNRNELFRIWLKETKADYILMLDSDMVPPRDIVERLLAHKKDIVGGLCFTGGIGGAVRPTLHVVRENDDGKPYLDILWDYPPDSLVQVEATGGACLLVHRRVAMDIYKARGDAHPMPWFAYGVHNGVEIGEDVAFCLTAGKVGYDIWVDTSLEVPHMKPTFIMQDDYVRSLASERHPYYTHREEVPVYGRYNGLSD